jgi:hypothetical protein
MEAAQKKFRLILALRYCPERNNPERNNPETRKNPKH